MASRDRGSVRSTRAIAFAHRRKNGATLFGFSKEKTFCAERAAWANGTAVRKLDYHDIFLSAYYSHPGDNISDHFFQWHKSNGKNNQ